MRTLTMFFLLTVAVSVCNAQWVQTNMPDSGEVRAGDVLAFAVIGSHIFAGTHWWYDTLHFGGVFLSTNFGASWAAVNNGLTDLHVRALAVNGMNLFAGTGGGIFLSTNNGTIWTAAGLTNTDVWSLAVRPNGVGGPNLFAGTYGGGVFLSTNNGASWTAVNNGLTNAYINALAFSGSNLLAGTSGGGVFLSANNGASWTAAGLDGIDVRAFAVSGTNLFAGTVGAGVFLTTNNGSSWTHCGGATSWNALSFAVTGTNLFAGISNSGGVFLSSNNGTSWTEVNTGLTVLMVRALAISGTYLFAGTWLGNVWRRPLSEMITAVDPVTSELPHEFSLQQNYPNPFNPSTTVSYQVPTQSYVSLKVHDVLGREVAILVNEVKPPGMYTVQWDASEYTSGVYFYRVTAGDFTQTKKLILIK